jgi:FtsH-binding integral membrane protein
VFTLIFVSIFVASWLVAGLVPWMVLSVATRGNAGLANLSLCMFAGVVGGLAVPVLGKDDAAGIWLSLGAAVAVPALLLAARRLSPGVVAQARHQPAGEHHQE